MNRRDFLRSASYVGSALVLGATVPRFIGEPAGGFYAPIPEDIRPYLKSHGRRFRADSLNQVELHSMYALWAPPGATHAALAMFAGTILIEPHATPAMMAAKYVNRDASMRDCLSRHHEPGWFKVHVQRETGGLDENGDPEVTSEEAWKRVGYVKWLTVAEADRIGREVMVPAA